MKPKSTKSTSKPQVEDESSLDCEARFNLKLKKVKVEPKLCFLAYVLLPTLFSQNHLLFALREAFFFFRE